MGLEESLPNGILLANVEKLVNWTRKTSMWPATFGLACCAIEMMTVGGSRYDIARFGMERFSATPRQADLMIVAGRVTNKMAPVLRQIYDQMPEPRWVLAMGVCASSGGMFNNYAVVQGVDHVVPVDMYLPGCPPRPEMLLDAILKLHAKVMDEPINGKRAAEQVEQGHRTELPASSEKYAPRRGSKRRMAERQQNAQRREMGAEGELGAAGIESLPPGDSRGRAEPERDDGGQVIRR
ncbi:NADH-quinone oxidoreductase subunit B [Actinopolyspora mzabensis]|uniref:NADH-quinone oxidoreductase subunit B n=1 Tax=Actinopolyspora mzabensis TaxID=995066 RepID=A0A1G8WQT4_ACTMZ|nr:NADH-quinone oxidoreductase subunit B [Actinopolyspora mzabensis]